MANLILGAPIYNDVGVLYTPTYAGGAWSAGNPLTNLRDRRLFRIARSASVTERDTRFEVDLGQDRPVRVAFIPRHTLSQGAKWRVVGRPSSALFQYVAGEDITARGGVFARSGTATFVDRAGIVRTAASGVPRDGHWVNGERTLLLEPQRTNLCIRSEEFDTWTLSRVTVPTTNNVAPDGASTADTLTANNAASFEHVTRLVTFTGDGEKCVACYFKAGTAAVTEIEIRDVTAAVARHRIRLTWNSGVPTLSTQSGAGTIYPVESLANGWYRILFSGTGVVAANINHVRLYPSGFTQAAGTVLAWGAQAEDAVVPSSYIPTAGSTVTRQADSLYFDVPALNPPRAMTVYVRGREQGALRINDGNSKFLWHIGGAVLTDDPRFAWIGNTVGTAGQIQYDDGITSVTSSVTLPTIARGDAVETRATLSAAWATQAGVSVNGGVETTSVASASSGAAVAWNAQRFYLAPSNVQFSVTHAVISAGVQTMTTMRSAYVDSGWLDAWAVGDTLETRAGQNLALTHIVASTAPQCRYWSIQISDPSNSAGFIDLARLCITGGFQPSTNFSEGSSFALESDSTTTYADGGNAIHDQRPLRRVAKFACKNVDLTEALAQFLVQQVNLGARGQCVVIPDPDDVQSRMQRRAFLAVPRELTALEYTQAAFGHYSVGFTEEL